jgi:hypothetical protein
MVLNLNNKTMRTHSNWNRGIYLMEDLNFAKEFEGYLLRKVGYSSCIVNRIESLRISDNTKWKVLEDMGESFIHTENGYDLEAKWERIYHKNMLGKPFCNSLVIDKRFPFPEQFDDTTKFLIDSYGPDIFEGWTNYMIHRKNRMFRYMLDVRARMAKYKRESDGRLNWGSTEWFITKY